MSATTFFLIMIVTVALFSVSASLLARGMLYMLKAAFGLFKKRPVKAVMPTQVSDNSVVGEWLSREPKAHKTPCAFIESAPIDGQIVRGTRHLSGVKRCLEVS
ncbi:hypothetical protein I7Z51_004020 [Vibrio parahaemolyticus]|uniref:hypothetical protein n=1 Tax=Gammaproteobacteria TaxID=1236 RepID=UPI00019F707D|nr:MULTISPECIES: hypothetical protein [Vibrio]HAS8400929.1 hypothetical protein [Vibrio vulnificus]ARR05111.1 hypothetical protein Vc3S01_0343 [Vibrio campbellii]EEO15328.1 hypothetical protein VCB_000237 [Vibrio cholerae TMA 21]EGQ7975045.1 hypothetical protein [Vibrio parahaemolyticus]EGR1170125.1 hypothetical protein [Vibrio parahaemolyticus]